MSSYYGGQPNTAYPGGGAMKQRAQQLPQLPQAREGDGAPHTPERPVAAQGGGPSRSGKLQGRRGSRGGGAGEDS